MSGFALLLLEAGIALALLLFIVWWTWPRRKPPEEAGDDRQASGTGEKDRRDG